MLTLASTSNQIQVVKLDKFKQSYESDMHQEENEPIFVVLNFRNLLLKITHQKWRIRSFFVAALGHFFPKFPTKLKNKFSSIHVLNLSHLRRRNTVFEVFCAQNLSFFIPLPLNGPPPSDACLL